MSRKVFDPKTAQFDNREITRRQGGMGGAPHFGAGMFKDAEAETPENGLDYLADFVNRVKSLVGRSGSKRWGDWSTGTSSTTIPSLTSRTGYTTTSTVSGNTRTITKTVGADFDEDLVGAWFVHDSGLHERVIEYTSTAVIKTYTESTAELSSSAGWMHGQPNGTMFHEREGRIIALFGSELYVADDIYMSGWTKCICRDPVSPNSSFSTFEEQEQYAFMWNANGVYRIDLSKDTVLYERCNAEAPNVRISDQNAKTSSYPVCHRYLYAMVRLNGAGNRNRQTAGVYIEHEGVPPLMWPDYGEIWLTQSVDSTNSPTIGTLTVPSSSFDVDDRLWQYTHFAIYRTLDVGSDLDVDGSTIIGAKGNDINVYTWVQDVPICKAIVGSISAAGVMTVTEGVLESMDVGCTLKALNGTEVDISAYTSGTSVTVVDHDGSAYTGGTVSSTYWSIGDGDTLSFTQSGNTLTRNGGTASFAATDVGKPIFGSDGIIRYIKSYTDANTAEVDVSETVSTAIAGGFNPASRKFTDTIEDSTLNARLSSYKLSRRLYDRIPAGTLGAIVPGFMFTAIPDSGYVYYGPIPDGKEYEVGYYYPELQYALFKGGIAQLVEHEGSIIVRTKTRGTHDISINTFSDEYLVDIGQKVQVIATQNVLDKAVGTMAQPNSTFIAEGREVVITQEPAIRIFDGESYGENLAEGRIMDELRKMQPEYAVEYHPEIGLIFFGLDED